MSYTLKVLDVIDNEDGSATVQLEIQDDFKTWFCEHYKLDEFNQEVFQKWVIESIEHGIQKQKDQ